jgi:hypothetical protein
VRTPVCKDCVDTMLAQIDSHAERARYEKRAFGGFLQSSSSSVRNEEVEQIHEKIQFVRLGRVVVFPPTAQC